MRAILLSAALNSMEALYSEGLVAVVALRLTELESLRAPAIVLLLNFVMGLGAPRVVSFLW